MARSDFLFTSESVSEGHPDKVADRISDEIVDLYFREGAKAGIDATQIRVAAETLVTTNRVVIAGEVRGPDISHEKIEEVVRAAIKDIGYEQAGFHWKTAKIEILLHKQSADIAQGVDAAGNKEEGAGDQGIVFGYAARETPDLTPAPLHFAHKILEVLATARKTGDGDAKKLGPDAKSQVTVKYVGGKPVGVTQIVLSTQHLDEDLTSEDVRKIVEPYIVKTLPAGWISDETVWHVNPTGKFVIGGPDGDTGLTGRKIIVDTYGGTGRHGGGAFSGKDPTKVDRSAAYMARYIAKNIVAAGLADKAEVQLAYAIGVADPVSVLVETFGTGKIGQAKLTELVRKNFQLTPKGIIESLNLRRPIYQKTAAYGHFGRNEPGFTWEVTDKAATLAEQAGLVAAAK